VIKFSKGMLFIAVLLCAITSSAQSVIINENGGTPDASAILELEATDKGILIPRMTATNRLAISSPAQALMVFQTDGLVGFYYYNGSAWDTLVGNTIINISNITNANNSNIALVRDLKSSGTDGGDFDNGAWRTRDLNDLQGDSSFISINGSDSFTLDSGIYVVTATAPARGVGVNQIRLYNNTTSSIEAVGTAVKAVAATSESNLSTVINVNTSSNTFIIQHQCENSVNTTGLGEGVSWGDNVYTQVRIQKL